MGRWLLNVGIGGWLALATIGLVHLERRGWFTIERGTRRTGF